LWNYNFDEAAEIEDAAVALYLEMPFLGHGSLQPSETGDINMSEPPTSVFDDQSTEVVKPSHLRRDKPRVDSDEWEEQREPFERLYLLEDKPLRVVAKIMKDDFRFNAT
jgi:hypothetical protein